LAKERPSSIHFVVPIDLSKAQRNGRKEKKRFEIHSKNERKSQIMKNQVF
jgi:hypothetical protein